MSRLIRQLTQLFSPAILLRFLSIALTDVSTALMAVQLGKLTTSVTTQAAILSKDFISLGILFCLTAVVCPFLLYRSNKMILGISVESEEAIFNRALDQDPVCFDSCEAGEVSSKLIDGGISLRWAIIDFCVGLLNCFVSLGMLAWFFFRINKLYTAVVFAFACIHYVKSALLAPIAAKDEVRLLRSAQSVKAKILENTGYICFLRINRLTPIIEPVLQNRINFFSCKVMKPVMLRKNRIKFISALLDIFSNFFILLIGAALAQKGYIAIGTILTMSSYYILISSQFANLDTVIKSRKAIQAVSEDISFILDNPIPPKEACCTHLRIMPFEHPMKEHVLRCPSCIDIEQGDKVAIIGENGAGKTTLLYLLLGLLPQETASVYVDGYPAEKGTIRKLTGFVDMNASSLSDTVSNYVLAGQIGQSIYTSESIKQLYDLQFIWEQNMDTLSGGQRKRADIARVFIEGKQILAFDEPEVGLDACWKKQISDEIKKFGGIAIFTTHDPDFISAATKIISINQGIVACLTS